MASKSSECLKASRKKTKIQIAKGIKKEEMKTKENNKKQRKSKNQSGGSRKVIWREMEFVLSKGISVVIGQLSETTEPINCHFNGCQMTREAELTFQID